MALLLLSNRSITRAGVRAIGLREVFALSAMACVVVGVLAFFVGMHVGERTALAQAAGPDSDALREGYAMERLGEMTARLLALENNASSLLRKISGIEQIEGSLNKLQKAGIGPALPAAPAAAPAAPSLTAPSAPASAPTVSAGAAGGPVLAPVCATLAPAAAATPSEAARQAEGRLNCLQGLLEQIEQSAESRTLSYMTVPNQRPIMDVDLGSPFGNRIDPINGSVAFHPGLDFAAGYGTPIHAAGGGRVRFAGWHAELGYVVELDHGNGLVSRYAHASQLNVKSGDVVAPGQRIAAVGSTGRSTGPHLHFEILHRGRYVDPLKYLNSVDRDAVATAKR